jgi:hypothetical protein
MPYTDTIGTYVLPEPGRRSPVEFLPGESPEDYAAIRELWLREYQAGIEPFELEIVERIAEADWRRFRFLGQLKKLEIHLFSTVGGFSEWTDKDCKRYAQPLRLYESALRDVETLRRQLNQQKTWRFRQICVEFQALLTIVRHRELRRQAAAQKSARKRANPLARPASPNPPPTQSGEPSAEPSGENNERDKT